VQDPAVAASRLQLDEHVRIDGLVQKGQRLDHKDRLRLWNLVRYLKVFGLSLLGGVRPQECSGSPRPRPTPTTGVHPFGPSDVLIARWRHAAVHARSSAG